MEVRKEPPDRFRVPKEIVDLLNEDNGRPNGFENGPDERPEPAVVLDPLALAGGAERRARETRRDDIHDSTPRLAVEGREIVPDRRLIQGRVFHPRHEDGRCEGFALNMTNGSIVPSQGKPDSEFQTSDPGA